MNAVGIGFWWLAFTNEARFALTMLRRYLFDTLVGLLAVYILFLVVFLGLKLFLGGELATERLDAVIVGYIMWMFALLAYTGTANSIIDEAKQGTLEQLFMAPAGFYLLLIVRMLVGLITTLLFSTSLLFLAMLSTGRWLEVPYLQCLGIILLGLPAIHGLGFAIAGIALVHKRVAAVSSIMQFFLIALVSLPAYPINSLSLLPFSAAANTVNQLVNQEAMLPPWWYGFILLNSLFYLLVGLVIFKHFEAKAKSLNVLGHY
ncbi:MAG: hypothetical protein WDZ30_07280 [Cellvibrionaceae bacterium]